MFTYKELLAELKCNEHDLNIILQHGLIRPISTDNGIPLYGSNTVDILKEEFDVLLKKCTEMDKEADFLANSDTHEMYHSINDKTNEERIISEEHEERSAEDEENISDDESSTDKNDQKSNEEEKNEELLFNDSEEKIPKKAKKKTRKKEPNVHHIELSSYQEPSYQDADEKNTTAGIPNPENITPVVISTAGIPSSVDDFTDITSYEPESSMAGASASIEQHPYSSETIVIPVNTSPDTSNVNAETSSYEKIYTTDIPVGTDALHENNRSVSFDISGQTMNDNADFTRAQEETKKQQEEYFTQQYIQQEENRKKYERADNDYFSSGESIYFKQTTSDSGDFIDPNEQYKKEIIRFGHETNVLLDSSDSVFTESHAENSYSSYYNNAFSLENETRQAQQDKISHLYRQDTFFVGPSYGMQKTIQINPIKTFNGTGTTKIGNGESFIQEIYKDNPQSDVITKLYLADNNNETVKITTDTIKSASDEIQHNETTKMVIEVNPSAEQEYEYRKKQEEKQLIVAAVVSKRLNQNDNNVTPAQYQKVIVRSTKTEHANTIVHSDRKVDFRAKCRYRITVNNTIPAKTKYRLHTTRNVYTSQTLKKAKKQYLSQISRKVSYQVHYEDVKLKQKVKSTQPLTQTTGRFFVENTGINSTDASQAIKLMKKYASPFGTVLAGATSGATMAVILEEMNHNFNFNTFSQMFADNKIKTRNVFFNGHNFTKENIDGFFDMGCNFFSKKYNVDFRKLSDKSIAAFSKKLTGKDAELWKALIQSKQFRQANLNRLQYSKSLRGVLFHAAMKTIEGTDAYKGGMLLYRATMTVRMAVKTTRKIGSIIVATPVAKKILSTSRNGIIKATNNNKDVVKFFENVSKKKASHIEEQQKKETAKLKKKNEAVKKRLEKKAKRKEKIKNYFSNTKAGKGIQKIMNTKGGKKINKALNKFSKGAKTVTKGAEKLFGFLSRFKMYVYLIFGAVFLIWILWTLLSAAVSQVLVSFYNTLPSLGKDIFNKVAQISVGDDNEGLTDREKQAKDIVDLIKHVYDKNSTWFDRLSENEKKTPAEVNGGKVYGGADPTTKSKSKTVINTWGCPGNDGIYYESYNGNSISVDSTDPKAKPTFVEGNLQSLYDKAANTKAIFCMTYIHYNSITTDNKKKMMALEDILFDRSHVVSNKVSDLYQCSDGCKTLKNYKCNDTSLSNTNCKGPVIDDTAVKYNFLKSDDNGKINNHSGKGCTSYYCTDSKKGDNSWKTDAGQKYGCKQKKSGIKETTTYAIDYFKTLDDAYFEAQKGKTYLTFSEIAKITEQINAENQAKADAENENKKEDEEKVEAVTVDDPTTYITNTTLSPKPNGSVVTKNKKTYTLKDGTVLGVKFNKNGTCKIYFHYAAFYCNGKHYGCPGEHIKTYCPGHVDLTIRFASAGIGEDEYDDCKLTALDPYKEAGSYEKIKHVDDNSPKPMWEGWESDTNINWLYDLYNQDWDELGDWSLIGMGDMNGSIEAGANDFEIGDYDFNIDENLYDINGGDGAAAAAFANSKLGIPYSQPLRNDGKHYDCSSLVYYSYKSTGLSIMYKGANTAAAQAEWAVRGKRAIYVRGSSDNNLNNLSKWSKNNWANLKPGDCIYYNYGNGKNDRFMNVNHAAIYYGNGLLIDASSSKGKVVKRPVYGSQYIQVISRPTTSTSISGVKRDGVEMRHVNYTTISHMKYTAVTSKTSPQYKILNHKTRAKTNSTNGIRMYKCSNGSDGKTSNGYVWRYCVAMGTYYGQAGSKFDIYFKGNKTPIRVIMGDVKSDAHTDPSHMYHAQDKSTVECIIGDLTKYNAARTAGKSSKPIAFPANNSIDTIIYRGMETSWTK